MSDHQQVDNRPSLLHIYDRDTVADNQMFELVRTTVERGADINETDENDNTFLMLVLETVHVENLYIYVQIVDYLVQQGADVNGVDVNGVTVLMKIYGEGMMNHKEYRQYTSVRANVVDLPIIKLLMKNCNNINNADNRGETMLLSACEHGGLDVIKYLLLCGADASAENNGETCLMRACARDGESGLLAFRYQ